MKNMKKVLFLVVAILLTTVNVSAMSKDALKDKLTKSYRINGVDYKLATGKANMVKTYIDENDISEDDCQYISDQVDKAVEILEAANVKDLSKLPNNIKTQLKDLANNVGANTKVPVKVNKGKIFVGYVAEPEKAYYNDDIDLVNDVKYTDSSLVITMASSIALFGIVAIAAKAKKQNA